MKSHPFNWVATIVTAFAIGIWLYMNFGIIHSKHMSEAVITEKTHDEDGYYVKVEDQTLHVKDPSTWMLLESGEHYNVTYEWYASKKPYVTDINQAHDDDQVGGH